ncbi:MULTISPECIES: CBS domain-containing protein [unclassified Yoonia]|uniref:CBS domain-containing protein n=1 Tax=unclassified Yoonia TaxID=2629118 RepID=UPI00372BC8C2
MGDTGDGPSMAAQSAPPDQNDQKQGIFARLRNALLPEASPATPEDTPSQTVKPAGSMLGMLNLRRMRVEDVAIPKTDIVAVPVTATKDELVKVFRDSGLTRLPVYDGTLDTPIGIANLKDFALRHGFNGDSKDMDLADMLRPLLFVPPSMPLGVLLQKMQAERIHMALVIDEYGGTDGLVTIEDLIEQVVGEIEDEHDIEEAKSWVMEKPGVYMVQARTELEDFEAEIGMQLTAHEEIDEEEIDTLGGLATMLAGHLPARGEVIMHPDGPEFEVVDADPRRIKRLRVRLPGAKHA